ncbi:MAG: helix-turn-helix domain-containing protein [Planctomycetaceae bacterium]|nr:helix-turn-helix domain-containing protein [Planctomycetaceae bacterium]
MEQDEIIDRCQAVTVQEAADLMRVSRPTVTKLIKGRALPSVQIGRCRRIMRVDLEEFLRRKATLGWRSYLPDELTPADVGPHPGHAGEDEIVHF